MPGIEGWVEAEDGTLGLEELDRGDAGTVLASPGEQRADYRTETQYAIRESGGTLRGGKQQDAPAQGDKLNQGGLIQPQSREGNQGQTENQKGVRRTLGSRDYRPQATAGPADPWVPITGFQR